MPRYRNRPLRGRDPRWILVSRPGNNCWKCHAALRESTMAWSYQDGSLYCKTCGEPMAREFQAAIADERNNTSM